MRSKEKEIEVLKSENAKLKEEEKHEPDDQIEMTTGNEKTIPTDTRMIVYDMLMCNVPTTNISNIITGICSCSKIRLSRVPRRTTIENMAREIGAISDLQAAKLIMT